MLQFWAGVKNDAGELIGFGYVAGAGLQHGYMEDLLVHPDYERHGIGGQIVKALLLGSERSGLEIVTLTFRAEHEEFYKCCGFTLCSGGVWRRN
ncbi:GNAT family N-acetyltransferase [Bacillus sp. FJAT-42376]|uniref:GNAT family N-acetyltransferase n=1 Tax=Bacillus sp. FJAT-42376 TaxID=2014076 RepID=UPI003216DC20